MGQGVCGRLRSPTVPPGNMFTNQGDQNHQPDQNTPSLQKLWSGYCPFCTEVLGTLVFLPAGREAMAGHGGHKKSVKFILFRAWPAMMIHVIR